MVWITLWTTRRQPVQNHVDNSMSLTPLLRFMLSREPVCRCSSQRVVKLMGALCLLLGSIAINVQPASANNTDMLKLYAHSRIVSDKQYQCFKAIIHKENRTWDVNAKNGSHYGIGQMRSKHYRTLDAYRQIDATLKYIATRYGSVCRAYSFHQKHGWY